MDRTYITTPELTRAYDYLKGWSRSAKALSFATLDLLGGFGTLTNTSALGTSPIAGLPVGFTGAGLPGGGANLQPFGLVNGFSIINISGETFQVDVGTVYDLQKNDNTSATGIVSQPAAPVAYGDNAADSTFVLMQCQATAVSGVFTVVRPGAGSNFYLVYATATQQDSADADDPNFSAGLALLPYYNTANPNAPLSGPPGFPGVTAPTVRRRSAVVAMTALQTTATALTVPAGATPLYIIQVRSTDSTTLLYTNNVTTTNFGVPGRTTGGGFTPNSITAAWIGGVTQQHHLGYAGTAPKIDGAVEWLPTGAVPNNSQKITGLAAGTTTGDAIHFGQFGTSGLSANGSFPGSATTGFTATYAVNWNTTYTLPNGVVVTLMQIQWTNTSGSTQSGGFNTGAIQMPFIVPSFAKQIVVGATDYNLNQAGFVALTNAGVLSTSTFSISWSIITGSLLNGNKVVFNIRIETSA